MAASACRRGTVGCASAPDGIRAPGTTVISVYPDRYYSAKAGTGCGAKIQGNRRRCHAHEIRFSRQYESRNTHAHECHHRYEPSRPEDGTDTAPARLSGKNTVIRQTF